MKRGVIFLGVLVFLGSCASTGGPAANEDWKALESDTRFTEQMQLLPNVEIYNLRISAFRMGSSAVERAPDVMTLRSPRLEPFGVYLGNGLAIDSDGNVFLDVLKLLRIDVTRRFQVTYKADDRSGAVALTNDETGMNLVAPRGKGSVVQTEDGFALKPASGKAIMRLTKNGSLFTYNSTLPIDPSAEMRANEDGISIRTGFRIDSGILIEWRGNSVVFNTAENTTWPYYIVTRKGDAYVIEYRSGTARVTFKVYFSGPSVYVVRSGVVLQSVTVTDSTILVNGKQVATYSRE